ncbi:uromodulin-like [Pocillopora verrucosa]|uniref:uromodulin-like n=1 Tax=Pocillopora verrucosa TaxID=203993 RepID=UPI0033427553
MSRIVSLGTFIMLCSLMCAMNCKEDQCRQLEFRAALAFRGKRLLNHKIKEVDNVAKDFCGALCFIEPNCISYNILVSNDSPSITKCEMNNATHFEHPSDLVSFPNSTYRGSKNACIKKPCPSNAICQAGFSSEGYRCVCVPGYTGEDCTKDVDECSLGEHKCDSNAECRNNVGSYRCKCKEGFSGDGQTCSDIDECALDHNNCTKAGAICTNTVGSFNCTCQTQYFWNGIECEADGCYNYSTLNDSDRKSDRPSPTASLCDNLLVEGWYRFEGAAGTKMPTMPVPEYRCGADFSGWLNGAEPTVVDGDVNRQVCFTRRANTCEYSKQIKMKNCGSYFIYKLCKPPTCNSRYCGTD